jgi:PAS domain S-box-containing protein
MTSPDPSIPRARAGAGEEPPWEHLPVALYRATGDGRFLDVNRAFVQCFRGRSRASVLRTRTEDLYVDPDDHARWGALLEAPGAAGVFEAQMRRLDGTTFWARGTVHPERADGGNRVVCNGLIEDVTERRQAEQRLQASELRYRRLFEAARDGILILDAETAEIVDVNPFLCELLELSREDVLGRRLWEIGPFGDVSASKVSFRELQTAEYIRYDDLPLETASGRLVAVEFVSNVYSVDGARVIQCNIRDITARKRAAETQAMLAMAAEQANEAIVITDARGAIVYVNPAFERVSGWPRSETVGRTPRILKSGAHDDAFYGEMWDALGRGEAWTGRIVNRRKDGGLFKEEATISPMRDPTGRIINYVAVKRDVTNEARLEEQLFQAQKMEAVGRLAAGVAHDFNNLLGVITGYGEMVHRGLAGADPLRGKTEQVLKAAERAADLTRQLLAFGRKQVLRPRILDLNAVVPEMELMLRRLLGEDIELAIRLAPGLGRVRADRGQIEQVLMNLAVNARDAMPAGGRITIETLNGAPAPPEAGSDAPGPGPYVLLVVADTGSGMDAATQARIFEPFFSTKEVGKGTGLGLATVYGIVEQSEGHVSVRSELGVGTTFTIDLPRVDEVDAPVAHEEPLPPLPGGTETVLLAEDEASLRDLLREALAASGYTVLVARHGGEAVQVAEAHAGPIHIMVTDVVMPGLTGPRAADLIAATRADMKVLYISGYNDEAVLRHGSIGREGAFLSKPFGPDALLRKVRESLDAA